MRSILTIWQFVRHRKIIVAGGICLSGVLLLLAWKNYEKEHWLSRVPAELQVQRVLCVQTDNWGFGPGGNETGVVLDELPEELAKQIQNQGIDSLQNLTREPKWKQTPIQDKNEWMQDEGALPQTSPVQVPRLDNYLNQYGFSIQVDPAVLRDIDAAISQPGNFYVYLRTGVLIVLPAQPRVAFVYVS